MSWSVFSVKKAVDSQESLYFSLAVCLSFWKGLGKPLDEEFRNERKAWNWRTETNRVSDGTAVSSGNWAVPSPSSRLLSQEVSSRHLLPAACVPDSAAIALSPQHLDRFCRRRFFYWTFLNLSSPRPVKPYLKAPAQPRRPTGHRRL